MKRLSEIASHVGGRLIGDGSLAIEGLAPLDRAGPSDLAFLSDKKHAEDLPATRAAAVLIHPEIKGGPAHRIEVENPYWAFAKATELFSDETLPESGVHETARIDRTAKIGNGVSIGAFCTIGKSATIGQGCVLFPLVVVEENVSIGNNCLVYSHVTLRRKTKIGDRAILHPGVVVGSDGFGFAEKGGKYTKIRQLGWVEIGDDVEIGANACIDRGALGPTVIQSGVKIDNLVHIAHNVEVGENSGLAAQAGIAGSTKVGKNVKIAGQVGINGHIEIGDGAFIGAQSGVVKSVPAGTAVFGYPARAALRAKKIEAILSSLPEWIQRIRNLEKGKSR